MDYNKIEVGKEYWTMHANRPIKVRVIQKKAEKVYRQFRNIQVWFVENKTTHGRFNWDLFETYEDLKNEVFPMLCKMRHEISENVFDSCVNQCEQCKNEKL